MKAKLKQLHIQLTIFYSSIFLIIIILIMINNYIAVKKIINETRKTFFETMIMFHNRLEDTFSTTETYLTSFAYSSWGQLSVENTDRSNQSWFTAVKHYETSFDTALNIYGMNGFFLYYPANSTFISRTNNITACSYSQLKNIVADMTQNNDEILHE